MAALTRRHLNAMPGPMVLEPTVPEDWSLLRTNCYLSRMKSSKKNRIRMTTNGNWSLWMIRNRRRSWRRTIRCCDPNRVAKRQCCLRLAWRPHLDHPGGHFRHRVSEGYWRWADCFWADCCMAALDVFCGDIDRFPGKPRYRMN
ncbi:MAG TPA: hypothetical protein VNZ47_07995 [Candidatus Dormibacteraeota bacterium]|nr:hypothetical protein [Candidatus Dormibacteraeota bacterium]